MIFQDERAQEPRTEQEQPCESNLRQEVVDYLRVWRDEDGLLIRVNRRYLLDCVKKRKKTDDEGWA